jgi:iron complex transport system substrate-binding protein
MRHLIRPLPLLLLLVVATACGGATSPPTSAVPGGAQAGTPATRTPTAGAMGAGAPATRTVPGTVAPATATRGAVAASPSTPGAADLTFTDATRTTSTLPRRPERFACLTDICFDILAELGLEPVAIKDPQLALHPRYYGERAKGFAVIGGSFLEPNLEDIAKARPDLVIGLGGVHEGTRAGLGAIAPLYIMAPRTYNDSIAYLKEIGRLTGRGAQADAAAQRFLDRLAAYKARSPKNKTALVMNGSDVNFGIDTAGALTGGMLAEVTRYPWPAPAPGQQGHESGGTPFSLEKVLEVDPDVLFVQTFGFGPTPPRPLSEQLAANPLWGELKAVKAKQVHEVSFFIWSTGRGTRALGLVLDEALPKLYPDVFPQALP